MTTHSMSGCVLLMVKVVSVRDYLINVCDNLTNQSIHIAILYLLPCDNGYLWNFNFTVYSMPLGIYV